MGLCCGNKPKIKKLTLIHPDKISPALLNISLTLSTDNIDHEPLIYSSKSNKKKSNEINLILTHEEFIKGISKGRGRFAEVFYGLCSISGEMVMIKIYDNISIEKRDEVILNLNKLYELKHKNILSAIPLYDGSNMNNNISDKFLSIIYEYCNGTSIESLIGNFGCLDEELIQKYSIEILEGLKYLFDKDIIPTNLTWKNIFIERNGIIKISDAFIDSIILGSGIEIYEKLINSNNNNINFYIPPFFVKNILKDKNYKINQSYTLWCLGCLLIEIYSGKKPWSNYKFEKQIEFINFLSKTNKIPEIPKSISNKCKEFLNYLLDENKTSENDVFEKLFKLDFLSTKVINTNENIDNERKKNKEILGKKLQNKNVINILNEKGNDTFSVSEISSLI